MIQHKTKIGKLQIRLHGQTAFVSICGIKDDATQTRKTPVLLDKMCAEEAVFQTHLRFPVNEDYMLHIETVVGQWELSLLGHVTWRRKADNMYAYGVRFVPDTHIQRAIKLALQAHIKQLQPNYRRIHQLYERMSGGASAVLPTYKFDQKG